MRMFHRLILSSDEDDLFTVVDYAVDGFDLTLFWKGNKVPEPIPESVKLFVDSKNANGPDFVGNAISWYVCSDKLLNYWMPMIENAAQIVAAPLYDVDTKKCVKGYKIINPTVVISALNLEESTFIGSEKKIKAVTKFVFNEADIPSDVHIFRPAEFPLAIIVSDQLAQTIVGEGLTGMSFVRCQSV